MATATVKRIDSQYITVSAQLTVINAASTLSPSTLILLK